MQKRKPIPLVVVLAPMAILAFVGCGYHFPGGAGVLPGGGTTVHVSIFTNQTRQAGLENDVQSALESEILRRGKFRLVPPDEADVLLEGVIEGLHYRPIAFSNSDEALQYETVLILSASLRDPRRGRIVWRVNNFRETDSYGSAVGTVVVQSSQFQEQSTLNAQNLAQLSDVQLSESQKGEAVERLLENVSRNLYNAMVEDF
jgi:hypothetical protein